MANTEKTGLQTIVRKNVRALRLKRGFSQQDLAEKAGLHTRYISRLETTDQNVTLDILEGIAKALGVNPSELLGSAHVDVASRDVHLIDDAIKGLQIFRSRVRTDPP